MFLSSLAIFAPRNQSNPPCRLSRVKVCRILAEGTEGGFSLSAVLKEPNPSGISFYPGPLGKCGWGE